MQSIRQISLSLQIHSTAAFLPVCPSILLSLFLYYPSCNPLEICSYVHAFNALPSHVENIYHKDRKRARVLMSVLDSNETMDLLVMGNSVRCYGHVLRREDGRVLSRALDFEVERQRKKGRPKRTWKNRLRRKL